MLNIYLRLYHLTLFFIIFYIPIFCTSLLQFNPIIQIYGLQSYLTSKNSKIIGNRISWKMFKNVGKILNDLEKYESIFGRHLTIYQRYYISMFMIIKIKIYDFSDESIEDWASQKLSVNCIYCV